MPTPAKGYYLKDGTRVPGVTTIIGRFKPSEGLIHWAWQCGVDGKDYRVERDNAASIGSLAHKMVEQYIAGTSLESCAALAGDSEEALSAFDAYLTWADNFKVNITDREIQLVSELYRFGGTPDAVGLIGNELTLLDWKTSNSIYGEYLIQLAAYWHLWNENFPERQLVDGAHLLRFAKEHGDFSHHYYPHLTQEWEQFKAYRECYERDKTIKRRAA